MFDLGFSELLLIAVVALVVLGPERLPKAARFAGLWVRKARAQWSSVRTELEREIAADELQRSLRESRDAMRELDQDLRLAGEDAQREVGRMREATLADTPLAVPPLADPPRAGAALAGSALAGVGTTPESASAEATEVPGLPATAVTPTDTREEDDVPPGR